MITKASPRWNKFLLSSAGSTGAFFGLKKLVTMYHMMNIRIAVKNILFRCGGSPAGATAPPAGATARPLIVTQ